MTDLSGEYPVKPYLIVRFLAFSILLGLSACASTPQLSRQDVLQKNDMVAQLDARLASAKSRGSEYLAPEGYKYISSYLEQAISAAQDGDAQEADRNASKGLKALPEVEKYTSLSQNLFVEVLNNRERAIKAGAAKLFNEEFNDLESELIKAANMVEEKKLESAKKQRPDLIKKYAYLELKSVKKDAAQAAKSAIEDAVEKEADDFAPKTFKLAQEELTLALSILEANRNQSKKASVHTNRAISLARQSIQITELVKDFDRRDYSEEDKLLWYQKQLAAIHQPLKTDLAFDKENRMTVQILRNDIAALIQSESDMRSDLKATESKIDKLLSANRSELGQLKKKYEREIKQQSKQREALEKRERDTRERFEYVQSLFSEDEAEVYRKRQNVLVLAHGFYFESGKSEIKAVNFGLLNKIYQAHIKFPESKLIVSGHTDATGNAKKNKILSEKRATNVAKFLQDTKGINSERITVRGYGAEKPVATNSTKEGRSHNRRIEVLIDNTATMQ
jgi:outer membrane protein OmpA-like peptidoglycan-associated protein